MKMDWTEGGYEAAAKTANKCTMYVVSSMFDHHAKVIADAVREKATLYRISDDDLVYHLRNLVESIVEANR